MSSMPKMGQESNYWAELLRRWPKEMPQKGVVVTVLNEPIGFVGFAMDDHAAVFQRLTPDALGARQVIVPFEAISYIKITAVVLPKMFNQMGFEGSLPKV